MRTLKLLSVIAVTTLASGQLQAGGGRVFGEMFPDGTTHDFGILPQGTGARHAFRIVNTSNVPINILSVRFS